MLGAICGDIIGSKYEFDNNKHFHEHTTCPNCVGSLNEHDERGNVSTCKACGGKGRVYKYPLFHADSHTTDDTICTVAIADSLMSFASYRDALIDWCRKYSSKGYGSKFAAWFKEKEPQPYNSWGNGSAMRVSPAGWWHKTIGETRAEARRTADPTHNHEEGYRGAEAIASAIFLARTQNPKTGVKHTKSEIKDYIQKEFGYNLERTCDQIRPIYRFEVSCQKSVPEAIIAFLESDNWEHAVRLGISLGGDSDTIAAMTGSIAEAFYGLPEFVAVEAFKYIEPDMMPIILKFYENLKKRI